MTGAAIAIAIGACLLFLAWQQRHQIYRGSSRSPQRRFRPRQSHLERKLLKLVGGDRQMVDRLTQQSQVRHPDRSADWHWEKVIYDLERDRWR
jgi:type II secretory pathway component PulJ